MTTSPTDGGYAPVNGLRLYYERRGTGGTPLVVLHGGYGTIELLGDLPDRLAGDRQVITVELQGHGHTADIDRPLTYEALGDDIGALIAHLGLERADVMGYSLGGGAALQAAIQHPDLVRKLVLVSTPFSSTGWYPDNIAQMQQMGRGLFENLRHTPLFAAYTAVAPDPDGFPDVMDKVGDLLRTQYDWSEAVQGLPMPVLLAFGDADSLPLSYVSRFYALLGGDQSDGGWDGSGRVASQVAVLPATTHYDSYASPLLPGLVNTFLEG